MSLHPTLGHIREDSPRASDWKRLFGGTSVPLLGPISVPGSAPGVESGRFFLVDLKRLTAEQLDRIVEHLSTKFEVSPESVRDDLATQHGLPILDEDVSVSFDVRLI